MNSRYLAAKLFFILAALFALLGTVLFNREAADYMNLQPPFLNLLLLVTIPRLIPFGASILSGCFGLVYLALERNFKHSPNVWLVLIHLASYLLLILGHLTLVRFWWRVLGDEHATIPLPLWAGELEVAALVIVCLAFAANIFRSFPRAATVVANTR